MKLNVVATQGAVEQVHVMHWHRLPCQVIQLVHTDYEVTVLGSMGFVVIAGVDLYGAVDNSCRCRGCKEQSNAARRYSG